ncbi:MAG: nitrate/nitrite transporter NrtS [Acidimicrobiia bacterium]|nr:nitrate/nitrite transporter NrtS [Acidimicrobiia bacterium]
MAPSRPSDRTDLAWWHRRDAVRLVLTGATFPTASRVAVAVGTLLTVVNQAEVILRGETTWVTAVRVVFNYLIPYVVASIGYLAPFRVEERHAG